MTAPTKKLVLLKCCDACNEDGSEMRQSIGRIEYETGLGRSTIRRDLAALKQDGILTLVREADMARQTPAVYQVNLDVLATMAAPYDPRKVRKPISGGDTGSAVAENAEIQKDAESEGGLLPRSTNPAHEVAVPSARRSPYPSNTLKNHPPFRKRLGKRKFAGPPVIDLTGLSEEEIEIHDLLRRALSHSAPKDGVELVNVVIQSPHCTARLDALAAYVLDYFLTQINSRAAS